MLVTLEELPKSPGHVFYDRLQTVLADARFDALVEALCEPDYAAVMGAPSLPPGRYFRMYLVGYFEGIDSERGLGRGAVRQTHLRGRENVQKRFVHVAAYNLGLLVILIRVPETGPDATSSTGC